MVKLKRRYERKSLNANIDFDNTKIDNDDDFDKEWELTKEEEKLLFLNTTKEEFLHFLDDSIDD